MVKLCECGCGQPAPIAKRTSTRQRYIKGEPVRFIDGHRQKMFIDLSGMRFGRLVVLKHAEKPAHIKNGGAFFLCKCDCGNEKIIRGDSLKNGDIKSCGCFQIECASHIAEKSLTTHGLSKDKLYRVWNGMIQRCENPNTVAFKDYGERGITVCDRWHSFENFLADMGYPAKGKTLDRIDNDKGYSKENCRWVTMKEQQNNRRDNHMVEFDGHIKTLAQWAELFNIKYEILRRRLKRNWPIARALTEPPHPSPAAVRG